MTQQPMPLARICYGLKFAPDMSFPWDDYDSIWKWWMYGVHNFQPEINIIDEKGTIRTDLRPSSGLLMGAYEEEVAFGRSLPSIPIKLINYGSDEEPMFILAVPGEVTTAHFQTPRMLGDFDLDIQMHMTKMSTLALLQFCKTHSISLQGIVGPAWWLSTYTEELK